MLTFGPPIDAGSSATQNDHHSKVTSTTKLSTDRSPTPNPKRSSGLTPTEIKSTKDAIDDLLADIEAGGFATASTNQTFPELEDSFQYRRPITLPEPVHVKPFIRPTTPNRNSMKPMGLGPAYAPPVSYSTKPKISDSRSRSAEPRPRRPVMSASDTWKRLGSSTYHFVDDERM
ncbi:uncharacterized protein CLAFUR5_05733 [Fulvia fulva]|uniref:Uncharacterized protein n=1 Tax=Passalora fulva TaxID=5499 RepID=A0A9Q8LI75_PASFU|nr:uncharacterized protein CLAFUR5_05733 [Fulvia fulva]KAK4625825.1 hypothetical protein CLAFUR0_05594 [Fulvia fulva]UJO17944.1 hypothetical protein CLAFUR5_05733 [Fulvia fulva]